MRPRAIPRLPLALCLATALCLAGVISGPAGAADPVKIGLILPLTGGSAAYGEMCLAGIRLAQAGRAGVLGRPVELVLADNKSDKIEAANAANRLIRRDHVAAILGPLSSGEALAAGPIAEEAKVPLVTAWATNPLVTQNRHYVFRTCFIDPFQGSVAANFAYHNLKARTAAVLVDVGRDYSVGLASFFQKSFAALGGQIMLTTNYSEGDQEFSSQLAAIAAKKPEVIYLPGYLPEEPLILRQAREMGLAQPFISGDAAQAEEVVKIGGAAAEGLYLTTHFDEAGATTPAGKAYAQAYRAKHGKAPDALGALGFDGYNILLDAIEHAGSPDPEKVVAALAQVKAFAGVCGTTAITGRDAVKPAVILTVKEGKFVYVTSVNP
jgi:branched-chain amino acid transport system substrate-binding protein